MGCFRMGSSGLCCSKPEEQYVFLCQFLLSEPFLRELISCTIKLHLLANSYNFFHDSVLVPPNFSIPLSLFLWQVAELQLAYDKELPLPQWQKMVT